MHLLARALVVTPSRGQVVQEPFFSLLFLSTFRSSRGRGPPRSLAGSLWPRPVGVRSHILMTMSSSFFSKSARYSLVAMFSRYTCA